MSERVCNFYFFYNMMVFRVLFEINYNRDRYICIQLCYIYSTLQDVEHRTSIINAVMALLFVNRSKKCIYKSEIWNLNLFVKYTKPVMNVLVMDLQMFNMLITCTCIITSTGIWCNPHDALNKFVHNWFNKLITENTKEVNSSKYQ